MPDSITVLHAEIASLEHELSKRRQALTILSGTATPVPSPTATRPAMKSLGSKRPAATSLAAKSPAMKRPTATLPAPATNTPGSPSLAERIVTHLTTNTGTRFTSAHIAEALAKTDPQVSQANVQRRLSDLFTRKRVTRADGRYGVP